MNLEQNIQDNPTIFGKILRGEIPCNKVYEDEHILAFHDIMPKAKVHVLVIPKKRILSVATATKEDAALLGHLMVKIPEVAEIAGVKESGFRIISNTEGDGRQEVPHLHIHIIGGELLPK